MPILFKAQFYQDTPIWRKLLKIGIITKLIVGHILWLVFAIYAWEHVKKTIEQNVEYKVSLRENEEALSRLIAFQNSSPANIIEISKTVSLVLNTAENSQQRVFFEKTLAFAIQLQCKEGIPASALIAQAAYESGYGTSNLSKKYNNYFGLKANKDWDGAVARNISTGDQYHKYIADFRSFASLEDGFLGYVDFIHRPFYKNAWRQRSGKDFIKELLSAGYCPDTTYLGAVCKIMDKHKLQYLENCITKAQQDVKKDNNQSVVEMIINKN